MKNYVLDACAVIAFILDEEGADKVENLLSLSSRGKCALYLNKINLLEIYYNFKREYDPDTLKRAYSKILSLPINIISDLGDDVLFEAGRLKVRYSISLADSIALAEAKIRNASIATSDHHEFDVIEKSENIKFFWIR